MPPTSYSRVEIAVVSGAVTRCVSSLADTVRVHPSGECVVFAGDDSTRPSSTGAASGAVTSAETGSASGSADAIGATKALVNTQAASTATGRTSTAQPSSAVTHSVNDHYPTVAPGAAKACRMSPVFIRA